MITNFEEITFELDQYELETILPLVILGLKTKVGREKAITNKKATDSLRKLGIKIGGARFRKIIQYIRVNNLISNLISTSKGYYISNSKTERRTYLESLAQRIQSMTATYDAMEYQHNLESKPIQNTLF